MVKKSVTMLLLLSMLAITAVCLPLSASATAPPAPTTAPTAVPTAAYTYPPWIFAPPWEQDWIDSHKDYYWNKHHSWNGYYDGYWGWYAPVDDATPRPTAVPTPAYGRASYAGITFSTEYLKQVWMNNRSLQFRLFGDNERSTFKLSFGPSSAGGVRMTMVDQRRHAEIKPVYDDAALNFLEDNKVDEVVLISYSGEETTYTLSELRGMLN